LRRSLSGPLILSTALHAGLFLGLLVLSGLRSDAPPITQPHVITVELVQLADIVDADGERDGGAPRQRSSETHPNTDEAREDLMAAEPAPADPAAEIETEAGGQDDALPEEAVLAAREAAPQTRQGPRTAPASAADAEPQIAEATFEAAARSAELRAEGELQALEPAPELPPAEASEPTIEPASVARESAAEPAPLPPSDRAASEDATRTADVPAAPAALADPRLDDAHLVVSAEVPPVPESVVAEAVRTGPSVAETSLRSLSPPAPGPGADHSTPEPRPAEPADAHGPEVLAEAAHSSASTQSEPRAQTSPMRESQQRMLEDRLRSWAERFESRPPESGTEWQHEGQSYTASFTRLPARDDMGLEEVIVQISTDQDGRLLSTEMRMRRMAFSHFAQFIDRWDPSVQIHDDEIEGRFHSNSDIYVSQSWTARPAFHGIVTTSRGVNTAASPRRVSRADVFLGGLETRVRSIGLPRRASITLPEDLEGRDDALHLDADAHIVFHADGSLTWRYDDGAGEEHRLRLPEAPFYVVARDGAVLYVRGTVKGKVLVYSPERVVIEGDLTYAADPLVDADSSDYLGLVSEKNVEIAEPATTGPGDLTIHGSIYAKRRFNVRRYSAAGERDATLVIYGSVTAGAVSATEPRYRTRISFDSRFERARPPGFPMTDRYEVADWEGEWNVEDADAPRQAPDDPALAADDRARPSAGGAR
jgi:hypothetical protein